MLPLVINHHPKIPLLRRLTTSGSPGPTWPCRACRAPHRQASTTANHRHSFTRSVTRRRCGASSWLSGSVRRPDFNNLQVSNHHHTKLLISCENSSRPSLPNNCRKRANDATSGGAESADKAGAGRAPPHSSTVQESFGVLACLTPMGRTSQPSHQEYGKSHR
jgi:hypothetical protein